LVLPDTRTHGKIVMPVLPPPVSPTVQSQIPGGPANAPAAQKKDADSTDSTAKPSPPLNH
jgi:hypothetical protein